MKFQDVVKEAKAELVLNLGCVVDLGKEFTKTLLITWVPILVVLGIYNLLK